MTLSLIVCCDLEGVIGKGDKLPWRIPDELAYFKRMTLNKPVIMGRKTYESIGAALPDRENFVVSTRLAEEGVYRPDGATVVPNLDACIEAASCRCPDKEIMIIGGKAIYEQAYPLVDRIYLTVIENTYEGDVRLSWTMARIERDFDEVRCIRDRRRGRDTLRFHTFERRAA